MDGDGLFHHVAGCADCHDFRNGSNNLMFVRDSISTPNSGDLSVVFTASSGANSFADGDNVYDGICEVCHTSSSHHQNSDNGDHAHHAGSSCVSCHSHTDEFHPSGFPDHSLFVSPFIDDGNGVPSTTPATCTANCHSTSFGTDENNPKVHDSCLICHDGVTSPVTLISGFNNLLYGGDATGQYVPETNPFNNCFTCHGTSNQTTSSQMYPNIGTHTGQVEATTDGTCETCHVDLADAMVQPLNNAGHAGCSSCHMEPSMVLVGSAENGPGNCVDCHGNESVVHDTAVLHNNRVLGGLIADCSSCHDVTTGGFFDQSKIDTIHTTCATCHDYQGTNPNINMIQVQTTIAFGTNTGTVNCENCHEGGFGLVHGQAVDHASIVVTSGPECVGCHTNTNLVDPGDPKSHSGCFNCHEDDGMLFVGAGGNYDVTALPGGGVCVDCHTGPWHLMVYHNGWNQRHYLDGGYFACDQVMATNCAGCHLPAIVEGDYPAHENYLVAVKYAIGSLHWNGSCNACHLTNNSGLRSPAVLGGGICWDCHVGYNDGSHFGK